MWIAFEDSQRVRLGAGESRHSDSAANPQFELGIRLLDDDRPMAGIRTELMARQAPSRSVAPSLRGSQSSAQAPELLPGRSS